MLTLDDVIDRFDGSLAYSTNSKEICQYIADLLKELQERRKAPEERMETHGVCLDAISRQAAIDGKISIQRANGVEIYSDEAVPVEYLKNLPTIQPVATDANVGDTISRQQAIDALKHNQDVYSHNFHDDPIDKYTTAIIATDIDTLVKLPTIQPEPSIPLSWIEKYIEWLKSFDNEFANLAAAHISVMVKKWRDEQDETD